MSSVHSFLRRSTVALSATVVLAWASAALAESAALISLNPDSATAGGVEFSLTVNGENFTENSILMWGETPLATSYMSAEQLNAVVPASLIAGAGTASVTVVTSGVVSSRAVLTINPAPILSGTGAALEAEGNTPVGSINDAGFIPVSMPASTTQATASRSAGALPTAIPASLATTSSGGLPSGGLSEATSAAGASSPSLPSQTTANQSATQTTTVVHTSLVSTLSGSYAGGALTVGPPVPAISSISPVSVVAGSGALTLTVNGGNFLSGAGSTTVLWNSTTLATTYLSSTQITAVIPASLTASPGSANISVITSGGRSSGLSFAVNLAMPAITSESPGRVVAGFGAFTLIVYGSNLTMPATVNWGSTPLVTARFGGSALSAQVPANLVATAGAVSLTITTAAGTSVPVTYSVTPPVPVITSLSPSSAAAGGATFTLTITGTGFVPGIGILWGTTWVSSTYVSSTQETATIPASLIATAVQTGVVIYDPGIGWSRSSPFTINPAPPTITSLSPASATAGGAGFMLTVNGTAFTQGVTSTWNTTALGTVYLSPTQLRISVPASLIQYSGTASITVSTAAGASAPTSFTINPSPPQIGSLNPLWVTVGGTAFTLTISGNNFTSASVVQWGSTALTTTFINANQLTAIVPASLIAAAGTASITVSTAAGTSPPASIAVNPALKITTTTLPAGTAGNNYSGSINVTGGAPGYTWTVTGLPDFMTYPITFDSTLTISGTPTSSGPITFQVSVQDTSGAVAGPVTFTISVASGPNGAHNASLYGSYVCLLQGTNDGDGTRWANIASFQADGQGNFINGIFDTNSYDIGSASGTMTGTYNVGADNNGTGSMHTILTNGAAGIQTTLWAIALSGAAQPAQQFRMVEADDLGTLPSGQQGTANCYLATPSAFAAGTISGFSFVFGLDGEDNSGNMKSTAGLFSASAGNIASGNIDSAQGGIATVQSSAFTATYTAPDPASGRFTMALKGAGSSTGFTVYIIDANRMFILDNTYDDGEQAGNVRTQQQASYSGASLSGPFVLYLRGAEFNSSGSAPSGFYSGVMQGTGDGAGNMTIRQSYENNSGAYSAGQSIGSPLALTFDSAHPGRATFPSASGTTYLYLFNAGSALEMNVGSNGSLDSGWLEPQTQTAFTDATLAGNYLYGNLPLLNLLPTSSVGVFGVTDSGAMNVALTTVSRGNLSWDQPTSMTYSWDTTAPGTGAFLIANGAQGEAGCAVVSATKFVCASQTDPAPSVEVIEQ